MRLLIATTAFALVLGTAAHAQTEAADPQAEGQAAPEAAAPPAGLDPGEGMGGATGLATGAIGETFFIREPQVFHLLVTEMQGHPVYFDTTPTGTARPASETEDAAGTVDPAIRSGEEPVGTVVDVVLDRRGGSAGLVVELNESMRGGAREVAVAMGLVRMLADPNDPASTFILLSLDPVDMENAPTFERPGNAPEGAAAAPQDAAPEPTPPPQAGEQQPVQQPQ